MSNPLLNKGNYEDRVDLETVKSEIVLNETSNGVLAHPFNYVRSRNAKICYFNSRNVKVEGSDFDEFFLSSLGEAESEIFSMRPTFTGININSFGKDVSKANFRLTFINTANEGDWIAKWDKWYKSYGTPLRSEKDNGYLRLYFENRFLDGYIMSQFEAVGSDFETVIGVNIQMIVRYSG